MTESEFHAVLHASRFKLITMGDGEGFWMHQYVGDIGGIEVERVATGGGNAEEACGFDGVRYAIDDGDRLTQEELETKLRERFGVESIDVARGDEG